MGPGPLLPVGAQRPAPRLQQHVGTLCWPRCRRHGPARWAAPQAEGPGSLASPAGAAPAGMEGWLSHPLLVGLQRFPHPRNGAPKAQQPRTQPTRAREAEGAQGQEEKEGGSTWPKKTNSLLPQFPLRSPRCAGLRKQAAPASSRALTEPWSL